MRSDIRPLAAILAVLAALSAVVLLGSGTGAATPAPAARPAPAPVAAVAPAAAPIAAPVAAPVAVSQTPCAVTAVACVDLSERRAWLTDGAGRITHGPVGALGGTRSDPTPTGTFSVDYKDREHVSSLYGADMPNSVFFAPAIAFHEGSLSDRSHGCIHLGRGASRAFFAELSAGDTVQVVP